MSSLLACCHALLNQLHERGTCVYLFKYSVASRSSGTSGYRNVENSFENLFCTRIFNVNKNFKRDLEEESCNYPMVLEHTYCTYKLSFRCVTILTNTRNRTASNYIQASAFLFERNAEISSISGKINVGKKRRLLIQVHVRCRTVTTGRHAREACGPLKSLVRRRVHFRHRRLASGCSNYHRLISNESKSACCSIAAR